MPVHTDFITYRFYSTDNKQDGFSVTFNSVHIVSAVFITKKDVKINTRQYKNIVILIDY